MSGMVLDEFELGHDFSFSLCLGDVASFMAMDWTNDLFGRNRNTITGDVFNIDENGEWTRLMETAEVVTRVKSPIKTTHKESV